MQHIRLKTMVTRTGLTVLVTTVLVTSCIDQRYDITKGLSTSITFGGDSLTLPLGSTDTIRLGAFLDPDDVELMKTMEDGGYALNVKDSLSVDVPKIDQQSLRIDDKTFTQQQTVNFGDINLDDFSIPGLSVNSDINFSFNAISLGDFAVPAINQNQSFGAGMSGYAPTDLAVDDINVSGGSNDLFANITLPPDPGVPSIPVKVDDPDDVAFNSTEDVNYTISVPDGVSDIDSVLLADTPPATFSVSLELAGASGVITTGRIVPIVSIDPSDLFVFDNLPGGTIEFEAKDSLTVNNAFKLTKQYTIKELNIGGNPNANNELSVTDQIVSSGTMGMKGVYVLSDKIDEVRTLDLLVKVSINDMVIKSMVFNIPTIQSNISGNTAFNIDNSVPGDINKVNSVLFDPDRHSIRFNLKAEAGTLPPMRSSAFTIDYLTIQFPEEFKFKPRAGLSGSTLSLTNVSFNPTTGYPIELELESFDLSETPITSNRLQWQDNITYSGNVSFSGRINSADIPSSSNDTKMNLVISSDLGFNSAEIETNNKEIALAPMNIPISFDINITDRIKRLDTIKLKPGTMISLRINKPSLPLSLAGNNLTLAFPSLFAFKPALINNRIVINDTIPDLIELELASLNIDKDLSETGSLVLNENISVQGDIVLRSGTVNTTAIENLTNEKLNLMASTDDLTISSTSLQLKALSTNYADSMVLDLPTIDLPEEILSLDSILLANGAQLQLDINITNMPSLSKPLIANIELDFPSLLGFSPGVAEAGNVIKINQAFVGGKLSKTIGLEGLFFDGKDLGGKLDINEKVKFDVGVSVDEATVNSEQLTSQPITVSVDVKLTGIQFEEVYGKLNPGIPAQNQHIAISGLPSFLQGDSIVLDITKPVITLETKTNLGIPIVIDLLMKPFKKGALIPGAEQAIQLNLPKATSVSSAKTTRFWIAPDSAGMPQDYIFVPADIQLLFKTIPDDIQFALQAGTDVTQQHYINLTADYFMDVKYDVTVPLAFGEDLLIVMRDTISDLDPAIGETALAGKSLELLGTFQNSIPLDLEVELIPLDGNNAPIDVQPVRQTISAGARDGSPTTSEITLKLIDPDGKLKDLRGFELTFRGSSNSTVAGAPITPNNYVIAELKARLAGGLTIDPSTL